MLTPNRKFSICVAVSECCTIHRSENQNQSNYNYPSEKKVDVILRELKVDTGNHE